MLAITSVFSASAAEQDANGITITKIYSYTQFGGGDIQIYVSSPATNCAAGFWLSPHDPGFNSTLNFLLSAFHAKSTLNMIGEDTKLWTGSGTPYCRLIAAGLIQ